MSQESILGSYRLMNMMYQGQHTQVWEAGEVSSGRHFALKVLLPEAKKDPQNLKLLQHEVDVGLKLGHPNVVKILKLVRHKETPFMVVEYFPGMNLKLRLKNRHELVPKHAHHIISQAAQGFAHLNSKGWVHRDIKPENILVNATADVRIIDFALATKIRKDSFLAQLFKKKGQTAGTMSYMSPEQIRNDPLDERSDVYSFGVTIYELATSRPPFIGMSKNELLNKHLNEKPVSPQTYNPLIADGFAKLVLRMLAKNKKDRPRDFSEFIATFYNTRVFKADLLVRKK